MSASESTLKEVDAKLRAQAKKKGFSKERTDRYVWGTKHKMKKGNK